MGKKTISIELSTEGINKAIAELKRYQRDFEKKCKILAKRIADRIAEEAQNGFNGAIVDDLTEDSGGAQKANVTVTTQPRGDYYVVVADGEDAIWVEFGAGVYHNGQAGTSPNPFASTATGVPNSPIAIGTFGTKGTRQAWGFYEDGELKITHGTPATMPMYNAVQTVSREVKSIAKEVFA